VDPAGRYVLIWMSGMSQGMQGNWQLTNAIIDCDSLFRHGPGAGNYCFTSASIVCYDVRR
jgi:hypothetical protein